MLLIVAVLCQFHIVNNILRGGNLAILRKYGIFCMVILLIVNRYYILILLVLKDNIFRDANLACLGKSHISHTELLRTAYIFRIFVAVMLEQRFD